MKRIVNGGVAMLDDTPYQVWGNSKTKQLYEIILMKTYNQMNAMLSHHCKVLVIRFDLRMTEYSPTNEVVSEIMRVMVKQLKQHYKMKRVGYVWAREQASSDKQHYHCALMIDGNKTRHPKKVLERLECITDARNQLPPYTPKNCYYNVTRGDLKAFSSALYRLSYLAKVNTKGMRPTFTNDYSTSRVKHNSNQPLTMKPK